jgi:hypothetical protein
MSRYTGHCRWSGSSDAVATIVQILLRTTYFTESLAQRPGRIFELFLQFYRDMTNEKPWLDINPLIKLDPRVLGDKSELADCFSGLFRLFGSPIPKLSSAAGIFQIPHENSITQFFSGFHPEPISDLGVIFFETRFLVLREIPETLGEFSLYVVVNRLSKTSSHLCFRDSEGWLSIRSRDIIAASSFRRDNISFLGYIRDLKSTHCFRHPLTFDHYSGKHRQYDDFQQ